jgi:S-disulfanyl-L-cysteine oxidoreductase SoxD
VTRLLGRSTRGTALAATAMVFVGSVAIRAGQAPAAERTVWNGVYTAAQAERGRQLFTATCAECHGGSLQGTGEGKSLRGDAFWTDWRESTVDALLTYISKNMPRSETGAGPLPGSLPASNYVDITAYLLSANELPAGGQELTQASSVGVKIIRKDGPGELPATTLATVIGCLEPRLANGAWRINAATAPVRGAANALPDRAAKGDRAYELKFVLSPLTKLVGHRIAVTGLLLGDGGVNGINVSDIASVADSCQ